VPTRVSESGGTWSVRNLVETPTADGKGGVVVQMPNGQLFYTISHGMNTMQGYAGQIPADDRWAIVAYVRALERSQMATNASAGNQP
jgi:mono/diheme cytochrome c family protein